MLLSADTELHVFEADFLEPSYSIKTELRAYNCAVFHKDSRKLIIGGNADNIIEVDIYNKKKRSCLCQEGDYVKCITFNKRYDLLAVGMASGTVCIVQYPDFVVVQKCQKYNFSIVGIVFANDNDIIFGDSFGHLMRTGALSGYVTDYSKLSSKNGPITSLTILKTGDLAVSSGKSVFVYDKYTEEVMKIHDLGATSHICASPVDKNVLIIGTNFGELQVYDVFAEKVKETFNIDKRITALAVASGGTLIAAGFCGGIDVIDLENTENIMHLMTRGSNHITALAYQPEIIAIPEDALFTFDSSTQVWGSKSQMSKSRTGNSMHIITNFEEEEDYTVNKISFRKSLLTINTGSTYMSPGKQCLSRSGIDAGSVNSPRSPKSPGSFHRSQREVSGVMTFDEKSGSPRIERRSVFRNSTIEVPEIAKFPSKMSEQIERSPKTQQNDKTEIVSSPRSPRSSSVTFSIDNNGIGMTVNSPRHNNEEISLSGDHIDVEPIPRDSMSELILEKLESISRRLDALESRNNE